MLDADTNLENRLLLMGVLFNGVGGILLSFRNADGTLFPNNESLTSLPSRELFTAKLPEFFGSFFVRSAGVASV
jgi:hypothetical protein